MKNKFLAALLSVVVAFGLWIFVITVVNPESEKMYYDIPVVLQNKEVLTQRGLMIVSETPKITLGLKSDRATLNDLNENNINVIINLANVEKSGTHNLTYTISYPGNVSVGSVSVIHSSLEMITLKVENRITKTVPIVVIPKRNADGTVTALPTNYITNLQKAQFTTLVDGKPIPVTGVEISGPESVVGQITQAVIDVDLNNRTDNIIQSEIYTLCNDEGNPVNAEKVTTDVDVVEMKLTVQKQKVVTFAANVIPGLGAAKENATVTFAPSSIAIIGDPQSVDKVPDTISIEVDLADYLENTTMAVRIKQYFQGVEILTGGENVQMSISFSNVTVKTFTVPVTAVGVPKGYEIDSMTQNLEITVRGPSQDLEKMTAADWKAEVDCSGAVDEIYNGRATVTCPGYPNVVPVESYTVSVVLKEKAEPVAPVGP